MNRLSYFFWFFSLVCFSSALSAQTRIITTIPILSTLATEIGGSYVEVKMLSNASTDPHHFHLSPQQLQELLAADIVITSQEMAQHLPINPQNILSIGSSLQDKYIVPKHPLHHLMHHASKDTHSHHHHCSCGHHHAHDLASLNAITHEWLSFDALEILSSILTQELILRDAAHQDFYQEMYQAMIHRLHELKKVFLNKELKKKSLFYHNDFWLIEKELHQSFGPVLFTCDGSTLLPEMRATLEKDSSSYTALFIDQNLAQEQVQKLRLFIQCPIKTIDTLGAGPYLSVSEWLEQNLSMIYAE
ncbi:MAG: hypothetical protein FJ161_01970 [Gammaproteobacteria bacterium]|nr:hypothetical protein [Gammaproteobacteria bacterium]